MADAGTPKRSRVAVHIAATGMTKDDYKRMEAELQASGAGNPEGRLYHAAYGEDEVHLFEVWESPEQFEEHRDKLFTTLQGYGVGAGLVDVHPLHSEHPD
jgi:hypothetical protein